MKILELCLSPDLGGLELYMARCCDQLSQTDDVQAVIRPGAKVTPYIKRTNAHLSELSYGFKPLPLITARRLARLVDNNAIEIVHIHWAKDLPLAAFAKWLSRHKPALVYTRQMQLTRSKDDPYHNFLYRQMDVMITITNALAELARKKLSSRDAAKVQTLYYGVDAPELPLSESERHVLREGWQVPHEGFLVGLFGRIEAYKGQHLLIEAIHRAKQAGLPLYGLIVGQAMDDAYRDKLKAMAHEYGIAERITFHDFIDNPQEWMQACDCVALTTVEETFGLVLAEAMRASVPVIGSDRGGVPEIIDHDETGLLFKSGDADDLYQQIERMMNEKGLRERLLHAGKEKADKCFDIKNYFKALRALFSNCIRTESAG